MKPQLPHQFPIHLDAAVWTDDEGTRGHQLEQRSVRSSDGRDALRGAEFREEEFPELQKVRTSG